MSDHTERPAPEAAPDPDAWEQACAEDLAAERARRRAQQGRQPGTAAEELRKLVDAVADKVSGIQLPGGGTAQVVVQQVIAQAKAAALPVIERNPDVFDHLASAGSELLAAYRAAVQGQEARWVRDEPVRGAERPPGPRGDDGGKGGSERIDLD